MKKSINTILLIALIVLFSACSQISNNFTTTKKNIINENLPVISHKSVRTLSDIQTIALEWKGFDIPNIHGYYIYRSNLQKEGNKLSNIAKLSSKYHSHYVDTNLDAQTTYLYSISVIGDNNTHSNLSQPIKVTTLPKLNPISFSIAIENLARQVKILWRPHHDKSVKSYIIQRNDQSKNKWQTITTIQNRLNAEYIDTKLKDNYEYKYRIIAVTFDNIRSNPSKIVKATTKALPNSTQDIQASTNVARKIILTWKLLDDSDIAGYNIYSSRSKNGYYTKVAKTKPQDNTFEDVINDDNTKRYYKITAFDKDGLETVKDNLPIVMGKTLSLPKTPKIKLGLIQDETIILNWDAGDNRAVSYNIYKTQNKGIFKTTTKIYKNITQTRFEDKDIVRGAKYKFEIQSVDENGLLSPKTTNILLSMPIINQIK
jgi:fibronectin type 3 domain-containing protein